MFLISKQNKLGERRWWAVARIRDLTVRQSDPRARRLKRLATLLRETRVTLLTAISHLPSRWRLGSAYLVCMHYFCCGEEFPPVIHSFMHDTNVLYVNTRKHASKVHTIEYRYIASSTQLILELPWHPPEPTQQSHQYSDLAPCITRRKLLQLLRLSLSTS